MSVVDERETGASRDGTGTPGDEAGGSRSRRRRVLAGAAVAVVLVAAAVGGLVALGGGDGSSDASDDGGAVATGVAAIERRDLVETESVDGTLGYADERPVPTSLVGTLTWLPAEGAPIRPDHRLFQVDGENVYLLDGRVPAWRDLTPGIEGKDVLQLEHNLDALGYDPYGYMTVDGDWDFGTTSTVLRWQEAHDLDQTGTIELGRIVFQPGARRVASVTGTLGSRAGGAPLTTTSMRRVVTVELSPSEVELARRGAQVSVELPSGDDVPGRITDVARVAKLPAGDDVSASDATVAVTIRLRRGTRGTRIDQAPVDVLLERSRARDALAIPASALLAQVGGDFAVEVREAGGERRIVPVETGVTSDGYVAIEGDGLEPGMRVTNGEL